MTLRVVVIGDVHLRNDARQADKLASLDQILREQRGNVGLWAVPGDLYDGLSDVPSRNAWVDRLTVMADEAPVVIAQGNHDRNHDLDLFAKVRGRYPIYVVDRPTTLEIETAHGVPLTVFVLPYPQRAGFVADGVAPDDVVGASRPLLDAIFMEHGARLFKAREAGRQTLFLGHANIAGSKMSTGQPLIGHEIELDDGLLIRLGDCPKVLSHIHLAQEIGGGVFCGAIAPMSWGETQQMRYLVVVYQTSSWVIESWPLDTPALVHVEAVFDHMEFSYDIAPAAVAPGSDVRVRVRFQETERQFFEMGRQQVTTAFAHARRLQIEPICLDAPGLRSPEVANATTLIEKLTAWCEANGEAVPAGLPATVAEYEALSGEQVVETFHARMRAAQNDTP